MPSFKLLQKIIVCLILFGLLAPTVILAAATSTLVVGAPPPPVPPGQTDPANFLKSPRTSNSTKVAQQTLAKWREGDRQQCEAEAKGSKNPTLGQAVAGAIVKPLKGAINEQLGLDAIPTAVNQTITNDAALAIEEELQTEIQDGFKERLKEEIPKTIAEKIEAERARGEIFDEAYRNSGRFKELITGSIRESLPRALNEDFVGNGVSDAVDRGLRRSLQENLRLNFGQIAKPTIETYYRAQIETTIKQIPDMIKDEVQNIQDAIKGTQAGIEALIQNVSECFPNDFDGVICTATRAAVVALTGDITQLLPEIDQLANLLKNLVEQVKGTAEFLTWVARFFEKDSQGKFVNQEKFIDDMIAGLSVQLEQSLTQPKNIEKLGDAITGAISDPINESIENSIDKVMDSIVEPTRALEDAIDQIDEIIIDQVATALDLQANLFIAQITVPITNAIDKIGTKIADTIDDTLGATLYPLAQGITDTSFEFGSAIADGINHVGYGVQDLIFPPPQIDVVADDFVGPMAPNQMRQSDYDLAQERGLTIRPDSEALRGGDMHWSDYEAAVSGIQNDGIEGEVFSPNGPGGAPLTGAMDGVSGAAAQTTQDAVGPVTDQALAKQGAGELGKGGGLGANISKSLGGAVSGIVTGSITAMLEGVPYVGPILAQVVEQIIAEAMSSVGLTPVAGGLPVMDVGAIWSLKGILSSTNSLNKTSGKILGTEKQTADLTAKILAIQIQTCTNLKAMRRVQLLAEEKMFVWDPNARKAAAQALNAHKVSIINVLFNKGYKVSAGVADADEEEQAPLQPVNTEDHLAGVEKEAVGVFLNDLKSSGNLFSEKIAGQVEKNEQGEDLKNKLESTISKTDYDKITSDNPEDFSWDLWLELAKPQNNPLGSYLRAQQELSLQKEQAVTNAREELVASGGVLPTRDCVEQTADGKFCKKWRTLTSGSIIKDYVVGVLLSLVRQIEQADENVQDFLAKELPAAFKQIADLSDQPPSTFGQNDSCPGPGPCPTSGWEGGKNLGEGQIAGAEAGLDSGSGGSGGEGGFDFDSPAFNDGLEEIFNSPEIDELGLKEESEKNLFNVLYNELPQQLDGTEDRFILQTKIDGVLRATVDKDGDIALDQKPLVINTLLGPTVKLLESLR